MSRPLSAYDGAGADGPTPSASTPAFPIGYGRRNTRRSTQQNVGGAKLKLKIASQDGGGTGAGPSHLQGYDRELDSDTEEPLAFEEQFILRMPAGPDCERLREMVEKRNVNPEDVWLKFKDSRRAVINVGSTMYGAKLVDLPCIVESQKTLDNKHTFKVADICQMLLVDDWPVDDEASVSRGAFNIEDFIYPHGLTPPLRHVRKRRFRKRLNKQTIETVERAVERLLSEDAKAERVKTELVDDARDLSDSDGYNGSDAGEGISPARFGSVVAETPAGDSIGGQTPADGFGEDAEGEDDDEEGSIDSDLAAEIEAGLLEAGAQEEKARLAAQQAAAGEDEEESDDGLFGGGSDDEEEESEDEGTALAEERAKVRLLQSEVKDLEGAVHRKRAEVGKAANVILKKRFEENLRKLTSELEVKRGQLATAQATLDAGGKMATMDPVVAALGRDVSGDRGSPATGGVTPTSGADAMDLDP